MGTYDKTPLLFCPQTASISLSSKTYCASNPLEHMNPNTQTSSTNEVSYRPRRKRRSTVQLAPIKFPHNAKQIKTNDAAPDNYDYQSSFFFEDSDNSSYGILSSPSSPSKSPLFQKRAKLDQSETSFLCSRPAQQSTDHRIIADTSDIVFNNVHANTSYLLSQADNFSRSCYSSPTTRLASSGLLIGDGEYEIVGDGKESQAVHILSKTVFHCITMKPDEYKKFLHVRERIILAASRIPCTHSKYTELSGCIIPEDALTIHSTKNGLWYVLLPDHYGYIHSLIQQQPRNTVEQNSSKSLPLSESLIQPIFKQVVLLVEFCHRVGIYFRDFRRLRKFVFTNPDRTKIRINNVLDLCVLDNIGNDSMRYLDVCPAYVSPEILDNRCRNVYSGRAADIWALGVLLFVLLNGRYPFCEPNPDPVALFRRIRCRKFSFPIDERVSSTARCLLHCLLRQNPGERPSAAEILHSHWLEADSSPIPGDKSGVNFEDPYQKDNWETRIDSSGSLATLNESLRSVTSVSPLLTLLSTDARTEIGTYRRSFRCAVKNTTSFEVPDIFDYSG